MDDNAYTGPEKQSQSSEIIGQSPVMVRLRTQVARLLSRQIAGGRLPPILIEGETGTGKGLMARALHRSSMRAAEPFIDVDCAAIPETLLEAELFGYERGAFTDARQTKPGLFQLADRGTIFLDEIGLLPRSLQAKFLKVVEDRRVRRLGGTRSELVDAWIITATNEDLAAATRARHFREDLYHRLAALTLRMPPLRERGADMLLLAERFLARFSTVYGLPTKMLAADAKAAILSHRWPGNVRELINVIERVVLLSDERIITADRLEPGDPRPAPALREDRRPGATRGGARGSGLESDAGRGAAGRASEHPPVLDGEARDSFTTRGRAGRGAPARGVVRRQAPPPQGRDPGQFSLERGLLAQETVARCRSTLARALISWTRSCREQTGAVVLA